MQGKFYKAIRLLSEPRIARVLLTIRYQGFMEKSGWFNAFSSKSSVDGQNKPLPWLSYPFLRFIEPRLKPEFVLFEFGCGNSTLYYALNVAHVDAVEHDAKWFAKIRSAAPANVSLELKGAGAAYSEAALATGRTYHAIVVDGRERVACLKACLGALQPDGVVILDDSERSEYEPGTAYLKSAGFRRLDFWGISPGCLDEKCTSLFYRPNNCLGI